MSFAIAAAWRTLLRGNNGYHSDRIEPHTIHALAALLFLVQLPHLRNLPVWISATGLALVAARLYLLKNPSLLILRLAIAPLSITALAVLSAFIIKWDFGHFIGRDPCVAFLFVLVAAKFAEVRRSGEATMLLCLSAFLLLTQYFYSQTIVSAIITLPAVVALAYCLCAIRTSATPTSAVQQFKLIVVLLLQGLPLAALLFIVFPRLPGPLWSMPEDATATTGLSDTMSPGSIGQLSQSDAVAFRVEFDDQIPDVSDLYWRGPVLREFDGRNWGLSQWRQEAPPQYTGPAENRVNYTITLQPHRQRWLFALDMAASLPSSYYASQNSDASLSRILGRRYDDGQIMAFETISRTLRYRQSSVLSSTFPMLDPQRRNTLYLPGRNTRTIGFAIKMRQQSASDSAFADDIMQLFNEQPFRYTLQPQVLGHTPVDEFLFDSREGFCEHFASAFVVMMRAAGIAARVVTGYQGGELNKDYMIVRQSDAHAWAEAFIDGAWTRFDPTSAVAPNRIERGLSAALPGEVSVPGMARQTPGILRDLQLRWDAMNHHWQRFVIDFDNDSQVDLMERAGLGKTQIWKLCVATIILAGLWSLLILRHPRRADDGYGLAERHWGMLIRSLQSGHLRREHGESASEYLQRAAHHWPAQSDRLEQLGKAFQTLRFQPSASDSMQARRLLRECRIDIFRLRIWLALNRIKRGLLFNQHSVR